MRRYARNPKPELLRWVFMLSSSPPLSRRIRVPDGTPVVPGFVPEGSGSSSATGTAAHKELGVTRDRRHMERNHPEFHRSSGSSPPRGKMKKGPRPKTSLCELAFWTAGDRPKGTGQNRNEKSSHSKSVSYRRGGRARRGVR